MGRIRLTQVFPFLIPLRQKQRKLFFYSKMKFDNNDYAIELQNGFLKYQIYQSEEKMINETSGYDLEYQYNKVYNLKLAAQVLNRLVIKPNETFSFWNIMRNADKDIPFKNGLNLVDGKIKESYGGGLCQLSNLLYWVFLHSPLTAIERSAHEVESFPHQDDKIYGTDATVSEGWLDLKMFNSTNATFQILIDFPDDNIRIRLLSNLQQDSMYQIYNTDNIVYQENNKHYRKVSVWKSQINLFNKRKTDHFLYTDKVEIGYKIEGGS